jgi:hypothetical protein
LRLRISLPLRKPDTHAASLANLLGKTCYLDVTHAAE